MADADADAAAVSAAGAAGAGAVTSAVQQWADALAAWAIPAEIVAQAPESPWFHDPAAFAVEGTAPRDSVSSGVALDALGTGGTVLDVGCGGGRSSLGLVPPATHVTGVDGVDAMLASFRAAAQRLGVGVDTVIGRWPDVATQTPTADVVVCHHVLYNVSDVAPFLRALTNHARRRVVIELTPRHPQSMLNDAWRHFWGIERPTEPSAGLAADVARELGYDVQVRRGARQHGPASTPDVAFVRRRLCLAPTRDAQIAAYLDAHPIPRSGEAVTLWWSGAA